MPRDLPGLYWDAEKNRYFPVASKPAGPPISQSQGTPGTPHPERPVRAMPPRPLAALEARGPRRRHVGAGALWDASESLHAMSSSSCRSRTLHEIMASGIASTSVGGSYRVAEGRDNTISAFHIQYEQGVNGPTFTNIVGDAKGWLNNLSCTEEMSVHKRDLFLASSISAVCRSGLRTVAVSFGTPCKIVIQDRPDDVWKIFALPDRICFDVWTAHLLGDHTLALGAGGRGIYQADMDVGGFQVLDTRSDVLSIYQQPHLVYTGTRSGTVQRFDVRLSVRKGQNLLDGRFERTSSITHLSIVHEWQLLVSTISGDLETHDLRFLRSDKLVLHFPGHVNSYITRLGIAIDPGEDFLFAGGSDCRIRVWSLRSGAPILSPSLDLAAETRMVDSPLADRFEAAVGAMQVTESHRRPVLWASSGAVLHRWTLGEQSWRRRCR